MILLEYFALFAVMLFFAAAMAGALVAMLYSEWFNDFAHWVFGTIEPVFIFIGDNLKALWRVLR